MAPRRGSIGSVLKKSWRIGLRSASGVLMAPRLCLKESLGINREQVEA